MKIYIDSFGMKLKHELLQLVISHKMLDKSILSSDDINARWENIAPEYLADAVLQIHDYPMVSVGWAAYLGMAVAQEWEVDWEKYRKVPYSSYYGSAGFDDMDEHIVQHVLGYALESKESIALEKIVRAMAQKTLSLIRAEQIEPQSVTAYHVFIKASEIMFKMGAAIRLKQLGYRFEEVKLR
jgi:hypothetical protein